MISGAWQGFCCAVKAFNKLMAYMSAMLIVVCALVLMYEVITRYVISVSNDWVIELCIFMLIAATFMAAAHTQRERAHVGIEILDEVMSAKWTRVRMLFGDLLSLGFCTVVAFLSWEFFHEAWEGGWDSGSTWGPKLWIPYLFMALGMSLLSLQFVIQIVEGFTGKPTEKVAHGAGE